MAVLLLASGASAGALEEKTFYDLGLNDFKASADRPGNCLEFSFPVGKENLNAKAFTVLSLHMATFPKQGEKFEGTLALNLEAPIALFDEQDMRNEWVRVTLPLGSLKESNNARLCFKGMREGVSLAVFTDSIIGQYTMPFFGGKGGFAKIIENSRPTVEDQIGITVYLKNSGSEPATIDLKFRKANLEDKMPEITLLKGEAELKGVVVGACQEYDKKITECLKPGYVTLKYLVRANQTGGMMLLPAVVEYINQFGEQVVLESNRLEIEVQAPEIKVKPIILGETQLVRLGEEFEAKLAVRNDGLDVIENVKTSLLFDDRLFLTGPSSFEARNLGPGETRYFGFALKSDKPGEFVVGCETTYKEYELVKAGCEPVTVTFEQASVNPAIIGAIALLLLAVGVYAYINKD